MILAILLAGAAEQAACPKPALVDRPNISAQEINGLMERAQAYVTCMTKAIEAQRTLANETLERARAEAEKGNSMVTEVNAFIASVKSFQEEHAAK